MSTRTFGIISDTHGRLPAVVFEHFKGVEMILHAGDVGGEDILIDLRAIAPTHAVLGNMDGFELMGKLPQRDVVDLGGLKAGIAHGHMHGGMSDRHMRLRQAFAADEVQVIVYGHTHCATLDDDQMPWVINPGSASQGRGHGCTLGLLHVSESGEMKFEIVRLD